MGTSGSSPSRFRHPERSGEEPHFARWFDAQRVPVRHRSPADPLFEGAGDALPFRDRILAGYRIRSEFDAHTALAKALDVEVLSVELVDPRFYHLDLTFCPLDDRRALVVPDAWDDYGRDVVASLVPEPIVLDARRGARVLRELGRRRDDDRDAVVHAAPRSELARAGLRRRVCPVDEFLKAGGGVRCLTLALDVGAADEATHRHDGAEVRVQSCSPSPVAGFVGPALLETTGKNVRQKTPMPVGAKHMAVRSGSSPSKDSHADYVKNIEADPRVRIRHRRRWHEGVAHFFLTRTREHTRPA